MSNYEEFRLPDLGEGLTEATIVEWFVVEGQEVALNDPLLSVETAKAEVELPSPFAGTVVKRSVAEAEIVPVGASLLTIAVTSDAVTADATDERQPANLVGSGPTGDLAVRRRRAKPAPGPRPSPTKDPGDARGGSTRSPLVRRLAADLGVELAALSGTGVGGSVTRADVEEAARSGPGDISGAAAGHGSAPVSPLAGETRIKADPIRRAMARTMTRSVTEIPHAGTWTSVDVTDALAFIRATRQRAGDETATPLSLLSLVASAVVQGVAEQPILNASWDSDHEEIVFHGEVNLGIAAASPRGLIVPNLKSAQRLSMHDLAEGLADLLREAAAGRCSVEDLTGGTITISNIGSKANVGPGWPIINPPEGAILGVGRVNRRPWVVDDAVMPRHILELSISIDHRLINGVESCTFLETVANYVASPALLLYVISGRAPEQDG